MVDSEASMHIVSKKDVSSGEVETLRNTMVVTANQDVHTNWGAQVNVRDLDLFVTVRFLDDTPAVLSLGKPCEEHGYSHEWASGQKPHLTKSGKKILCKMENVVPVVVTGIVAKYQLSSSSSTSFPQDSSSTSLSPASLRRDEEVSGNWCDPL